jgi:hypothetical protein
MLEEILKPLPFIQFATTIMLAVLFLQSGLDKVLDFRGNLGWLTGHFAKSPLRGTVLPMLVTVTITELAAGALSAAGAARWIMHHQMDLALWGARLATLNVIMLFFGQRLAKDYAGAAALVPYFILCAGAVALLAA